MTSTWPRRSGARALRWALMATLVGAAPAMAQSRGELLYTTHCSACHTTQMHWRDNRAATDWAGLRFQVKRWQRTAGLGWNETDILEVARYLNETIYRFEQTSDPVSSSLLRRRGPGLALIPPTTAWRTPASAMARRTPQPGE